MARTRTKISGAMFEDASITSADLGADIASGSDLDFMALKVGIQNNLNIYNLKDGIIDRYNDASGVDASASTNEVRNASKYYHGQETITPTRSGNWDATGTGGPAGYTWYRWTTVTSSGSFTTDAAEDYKYLVVAGGGGGGAPYGGGGGAGGVRYSDKTGEPHSYSLSLAAGTYSVVVGDGGVGGVGPSTTASANGDNSSFATISATGGGRGGGNAASGSPTGGNGGSGGGGNESGPIGTGNAGGYSPVEGYDGSPGHGAAPNFAAGSGGGAEGVGVPYVVNSVAGTGGPGIDVDGEGDGSSHWYAGGGGGSSNANGSPVANGGPGGIGGGGGGSRRYNGSSGTGGAGRNPGSAGTNNGAGGAGGANTGGGGGGGQSSDPTTGGKGGSGIVIIRVADSASSPANMTLISNAQTAAAAPTTGRIMVLDEASTGTTTINSDIKAYISRDNGTTYSLVTLTDDGEYDTGKRMLSGSVDISGQPSGTSMRYKIETLNQGATKITRVYGTALMW